MKAVRLSQLIGRNFYRLHRDIARENHSEYWLKGGRGSLKSSFVSLEIVQGIVRHPGANAIIYRKVGSTLRESVYSQMLWAIEMLGLGSRFKATLSPLEIRYLPTGQKIMFRGSDDAGKSKSIKLAEGYFKYLWFEELTEFEGMDEILTIKASVIRGGGFAMSFYSYNPPRSMRNWVNAEAMTPREGRCVHHSDYRQVPSKWLGTSFIAEAKGLSRSNERAYRHIYLGEVVGTGGQVFDNVCVRAVPDEERNRLGALRYGLDFGFAVDPDAAVAVQFERRSQRLYILREHYAAGSSFEKLSESLGRLNPEEASVMADSADPRAIAELRGKGLRVLPVRKGSGSVEHGLRWLQGLGEIVIDPKSCPNAAREFLGYEYAQDRHGNFRADYPDRDNHTIDAVRYALEDEIRFKPASAPPTDYANDRPSYWLK